VPDRNLALPIQLTAWLVIILLVGVIIIFGWGMVAGSWNLSAYLPILMIAGLSLIHAILALLLELALADLPIKHSHHHRLAFILSFSPGILVPALVWLMSAISTQPELHTTFILTWVVAAWFGAFIGCLFAMAKTEGLWEDNSPPPAAIEEAVFRTHKQLIGKPEQVPWLKRTFDVIVSVSGILLSSPIWLSSMFLIWLEDPGPLMFVKNSVGRGGKNFRQLKMRTMVRGAEETTGPVMAQEKDTRVLRTGRLLRKTHLDEIPQLINILKGEMSVVGPRPQRTVLVFGYLVEMPEYALRHRVLPGLAGLAQVAGSYYLTPRQKLRFDRLYITHMSLGYDIRLLLAAFLIAFWYRWQSGWNGRLPRWILHG